MFTKENAGTVGRHILSLIFCLCLFPTLSATSFAVDNPDAPDYIGAFKARSEPYIQAINKPDNSTRAYLKAYNSYQRYLDKELNTAYSQLMAKLTEDRKAELKTSQLRWLKYRDAEFDFINHNWTRSSFGSSFAISRGAYRCSIIEQRVMQLFHYLKNY